MVIKTNIKTSIKKFCKAVEDKGYPLDKVILFGSYIRGKKKYNDIDLALFSKNFGKDRIEELMMLNKIASQFELSFDPIPFTLQDLDDKYSTLTAEVKKGQVFKFS